MAMLAEPRRKVRYTVNPTGKDWAKQQTSGEAGEAGGHYGQRMLLSMGWQAGQGLGKSGQGAPEPIRVKRKSDQRGVGCTGAYAAETMPQNVEFASLLSQLNAEHGDSEPDQVPAAVSLEAKSRESRARLHYHKFTRGKDVSAYDSRAIACILGSRAAPAADEAKASGSESESDRPAAVGFGFCEPQMKHSRSQDCLRGPRQDPAAEESHGLQLVQSQTSLQDYFRLKMQAKQLQQRQQPDSPADSAGWTSESSCSAASTPEQAPVATFRLSPSPQPLPAPQPPKQPSQEPTEFALVVDFDLFPGCKFQRVLGYRFY